MKLSSFLLWAPALLFGCKDDQDLAPLVLTGTYQSGPTIVANPITMYTKNGPVQSATVVDNFLRRQRNSYFSRTDEPLTDGSYLTLTIRPDNKATLTSGVPASSTSVEVEVTTQTPQYFTLANLDSISILAPNSTPNRCEQLGQKIKTVYPAKRCVLVSSATGFGSYCRQRLTQVVTIRDQKLYLPLFSWLVKSQYCSLAYSGERNTFNAGILSQLADGDTIVVQVKELALVKK